MSSPTKSQVRSRLRAARAQLSEAELARRGESIASSLAQHIHPDAVVAGYMPMLGEPDVRQFLERHAAGMGAVHLPVVPPSGHLLRWQQWTPETRMRRHPRLPLDEPDTHAPEGVDSLMQQAAAVQLRRTSAQGSVPPRSTAELVVLIPTLALDAAGARLGQGGGYYDATTVQLLSELHRHPDLRCELIAVVHAAELLDRGSFPVEDHDLRVARAVTEYGIFDLQTL